MTHTIQAGILGASGYTGADLVRLLSLHPYVNIVVLTANANAGRAYGDIYPHLAYLDLPVVQTNESADFSQCDVVFCGLPHGVSQDIVKTLPESVKIIDLSADFRLQDPDTYARWYNRPHTAMNIQSEAVYGLCEHARKHIQTARLVACPGCYPTATLMGLLPLARAGVIKTEDIIIDAKSGVSGAGRKVQQSTLFCETAEQMHPYGVASHRHAPEIEQELGKAFGDHTVLVNFTPHLVPLNRGELVTMYVKHAHGKTHADIMNTLKTAYADERFIRVTDDVPSSRMVKGSNMVVIGAKQDRLPNRSIVIATLDNLVKGSSGQAIQNMNIMFGFPESTALEQAPNFP